MSLNIYYSIVATLIVSFALLTVIAFSLSSFRDFKYFILIPICVGLILIFGYISYSAGRHKFELEAIEARVGKFYLDKNNDRKFCFITDSIEK
jgi:hypothetical protein